MFRQYKDAAEIFRQTYVDGKSSYAPTCQTCIWYLHPLSPEKNNIAPEKFGKEFAYTVDSGTDIQDGDKLTISGESYRVKWAATYTGITVRTKRILLVKE